MHTILLYIVVANLFSSSLPQESQTNLRRSLSLALKNGGSLIFSCQQASPNMSSLCHDGFPAEVFSKGGKEICTDEWAGKIITDGDAPEGVKIPHADFTVVVTSWFKVSDLDDFFFAEGMGFATVGKDKFQVIEIEHDEGTEMME